MTTPAARCLALDFGGTIATPGPSPHGLDVTEMLRNRFAYPVPPGLADTIESVRIEAVAAGRRGGPQVRWETILATAARRAAVTLPDLDAVTGALWDSVPDGVVDPAAATAVHRLHRAGWVLVLACNTQRSLARRQRTLASAGLAGCFTALVLSSVAGAAKPDPAFYAAVCTAARCEPGRITFVGDTLGKDVIGPLRFGMQAVLVSAGPAPAGLPAGVPVITHLAGLPDVLERSHAR